MISVSGLHVRAGSFTLQGVDLEVPSGAYTVLMGKTGSGKTTLLESIDNERLRAPGLRASGPAVEG